MRKRFIWCGLVLMLLTMSVSAQSRSAYWQRWDVVIDNVQTSENKFRVQERYEIVFNGSFSFGTREIPLERTADIANVRVFQAGEPLTLTCNDAAGTACIRESDGNRAIRYYFLEPVRDETVSITIEYTVVGGLRSYEDGDQLWWVAVPSDRPASVVNSTIVVNLPEPAVPRREVDPVVTYGETATVDVCEEPVRCNGVLLDPYIDDVAGAVVVANAQGTVSVGENFEIRVQYPHNPAMAVPAWQQIDDVRRSVEGVLPLVIFLLAAFIAIAGPLAILARYWTRGRDPSVGPVPEYLSEPPSDLPPALVGALVDEQADLRDIFSTVLDLANRGYLVIEEDRDEGVIFGIGAKTEITFKRTDKGNEGLREFEIDILRYIFKTSDEKRLKELKNRFYKYIGTLQTRLYKLLVGEGFFEVSPATVRNGWQFGGVGLLVMAVTLFVIVNIGDDELVATNWIAVWGAIGFSGLVMILFSQYMPAKTRAGALEAAKWRAFREYLQNLERYTDVETAADQFDRYLPYAVAFGLDDEWMQHFTRRDVFVPVPRWYFPTYVDGPFGRRFEAGTSMPSRQEWQQAWGGTGDGSFSPQNVSGNFSLDTVAGDISSGLNSISRGITDMLNETASVMQSRPSSSGSSSGSWSGGGGSFSGGGFSGGGGGGGSAGFG